MGRKIEEDISSYEQELYRRVNEVLHYLWDPIDVKKVPEARDEYFSYIPHVFSLLEKSKEGKDITEYLISIERDSMRFHITDKTREHASEVAEILMDYRDNW